MAKRSRDQRWTDIRALRRHIQEYGRVKLRVSMEDIPVSLVVEVRDEQGELVHLSTTQASTEWQTVTEWIKEALESAIAEIEDKEGGDVSGS